MSTIKTIFLSYLNYRVINDLTLCTLRGNFQSQGTYIKMAVSLVGTPLPSQGFMIGISLKAVSFRFDG